MFNSILKFFINDLFGFCFLDSVLRNCSFVFYVVIFLILVIIVILFLVVVLGNGLIMVVIWRKQFFRILIYVFFCGLVFIYFCIGFIIQFFFGVGEFICLDILQVVNNLFLFFIFVQLLFLDVEFIFGFFDCIVFYIDGC